MEDVHRFFQLLGQAVKRLEVEFWEPHQGSQEPAQAEGQGPLAEDQAQATERQAPQGQGPQASAESRGPQASAESQGPRPITGGDERPLRIKLKVPPQVREKVEKDLCALFPGTEYGVDNVFWSSKEGGGFVIHPKFEKQLQDYLFRTFPGAKIWRLQGNVWKLELKEGEEEEEKDDEEEEYEEEGNEEEEYEDEEEEEEEDDDD